MTCRQCQRILSPHLDNALEADERSRVLTHLTQCPACTARLQQFESNRQLLHVLPTAEVSGAMELRLQSRVQSREETRGWRLEARPPSSQVSSFKSQVSSLKPQAWWQGWGAVSVGTLATCTASLLLYFSTLQAPPDVSAEEVVSSMEQLLNALDPDDGDRIITTETAEEAVPNWREEFDRWLLDHENKQD